MRKINLSPRLTAIVSLCSESEFYADVGTDHAYIPIYLAQKYKNSKIFASDIRKGPINIARKNAASYGVSERIEFFVADGLGFSAAKRAETVIIAGIGGKTIINILESADWSGKIPEIILQPQSKIEELLKYLRENDFTISDAMLSEEKGRVYVVIKVSGNEKTNKTESLEEILRNNAEPLLKRWMDDKKRKAEKINEAQKKSAKSELSVCNADVQNYFENDKSKEIGND